MLKGLSYLHRHEVIQRNIRCDNVFVHGNSGEVKIGDLGMQTLRRLQIKDIMRNKALFERNGLQNGTAGMSEGEDRRQQVRT